jgi:hypothetical protein
VKFSQTYSQDAPWITYLEQLSEEIDTLSDRLKFWLPGS